MSRRRIALRRGVVIGLLLVCVVLFTTFFREGEGGFLHKLQGTVTSVVTPVQDVAVAAIQPVKDGWNWFGDLRGARAERDRLALENAELREKLTAKAVDGAVAVELRKQLKLAQIGRADYTPVAATIIGRSQIDYNKRVSIDRGTNHGVTKNSLVFVPGERNSEVYPALIGLVTRVEARSSIVTFITDPANAIAAKTESATNNLGLLRAGAAGQLKLEGVPGTEPIAVGDVVVTTGAGTDTLPSVYPSGIPLGVVTSVSSAEQEVQTVQVEPFRNPSELTEVMVFTPASALAKRRADVP